MMCECDRDFAERFLQHQLAYATEENSRGKLEVTLGFVPTVCNECRGLPPEPFPKAAIHGHTSKISRYYWREIYFETTRRLADWAESENIELAEARRTTPGRYKEIEREVREEIKALHATQPKYLFENEESQSELLSRHGIEVLDIKATYIPNAQRKVSVVSSSGQPVSVEQLVKEYFGARGYEVLFLESRPWHAMFGVYLWLLIQDPADERTRMAGFGDRHAFDRGEEGTMIWTSLPDDFGVPGYAERRSIAIEEYFDRMIPRDRDELLWCFDYWNDPSANLRNYLWAHKQADVETARRLVELMSPAHVRAIMRYLVSDYWRNYLGWPDLLVYRDSQDWFFTEVKSSGDKLSDDQKRWIDDNALTLKLPFKVVKVHRARAAKTPP